MSKCIRVRQVCLGEGTPKICVSLTGATLHELAAGVKAIRASGADIAEWRADYFEDIGSPAALAEALAYLRQALGEMPLLFTFRTQAEGGRRALSPQEYVALNQRVIAAQQADVLDIELFAAPEDRQQLIQAAHDEQILVVLSSHDFEKTPPQSEMAARLRNMCAQGADIAKLAVMPHSPADVLALLSATNDVVQGGIECPVITMSMGSLGAISRVAGGLFGSCLTFGAVGGGSAPGQMAVEDLRTVLDMLEKEQPGATPVQEGGKDGAK